LTKTT